MWKIMKTNYFKSFDELDWYLKQTLWEIWSSQRDTMRAVWKHLRKKVRDAHWKAWPWWLKSRSNNTPLLKTWKLRNAVSFKTTTDTVEVYSKMEWLAVIHEYWVTYKMSEDQRKWLFANIFKDQWAIKWRPRNSWGSGMITIPARPIWRRILKAEENNIVGIAESYYKTIFK